MNTKLATITTQYSKFSDNQVLTKRQLNQFLEYFEDQDHLSRIGLSGVGIVCGFNIRYHAAIREIEITQGYGITTDGDLLTLIEPETSTETANTGLQLLEDAVERYTHFRAYTSDNVKYKPFFYNGENQIDILEIFPGTPEVINDDSYTPLTTLSAEELSDKVVFLYLENYPKEGDLCTALNCDSQGIEQVAKLRVLLISTADAKTLTTYDDIFKAHDWYEIYDNLPNVAVRRDILSCINTDTYRNLKQNYYKLIKESETLTDLKLGLDTILTRFEIPTISSAITDVFDFVATKIPEDFQYRYDLLKDLVDTYTEIKELLLHINVHCCPDIGSFPKHLMLGKLVESNPFPTQRHRFYKSPIIGQEDANLQRVQSLIHRVIAIVYNYNQENKGNEIKITPSQAQGVLGQKAIPFYYHVTDALINHWDFNKYINFVQKTNLSYHTTHLSSAPFVRKPLDYSLDHTNFLTIEGIQGRPYRDALEQVLDLKESYGLNFDVKVLSMNATRQNIDLDDYRCQFEDLNVLLQAWTTEQECTLASVASFFSGFSTQEVGKNIKEVEYTQKVQIGQTETAKNALDRISKTSRTSKISSKTSDERISKSSNRLLDKVYKKNVVDQNITEDESTIGYHMKRAIKDNKKGSINDIKNTAKEYIEPLVTGGQWEETEEAQVIRDLVVYDAIDLMAATYVLTEKVPQNIAQIDLVTIDTYELTLQEVCDLVKRLKVTYQRVALDDTLHQILGLLINQLSFVCCSGEKLTILLEEIEKRKQEILNQIQLSEFVKKHPGLRHRRGVPQGGTFVMAYITEEATDEPTYETVTMELDFLDQPNIDDQGTDGDEGTLQLWDDRLSTRFAFLHRVTEGTQNPLSEVVMIGRTIEITVSNFADFLNNIWSVAGAQRYCTAIAQGRKLTIELKNQPIRRKENYILFFNPALTGHNRKRYFDENDVIINNITRTNTVVADFALPYLCCSDCAPVNFVIPKEPISLSLPLTEVCLDDNVEIAPIPFTVTPTDGEIKAFVEGTEINDVIIQDESGTNFLNVSAVEAAHYSKPMTFTVNDEETTVEIVIYADVQLTVTTSVDYSDNHTQALVTYNVSGTRINGLRYNWDLGNDTHSTTVPDSDGIFEHTYNLPVNNANIITPGLSVNNGPCPHIIDIDPIVFEDPIPITLDIISTFCIDSIAEENIHIPFENISPEGGTIEIANDDLSGIFIEEETLVIIPTQFDFFDREIQFTIEGQNTGAAITISNQRELFAFEIGHDINYNELQTQARVIYTLFGNVPDGATLDWDYKGGRPSDEATEPGTFIRIYDLPIPGSQTIEPILTITKGPCEAEIPIGSITFDDPLVPSLSIRPTFCMEAGTGEFDIDFTNMSPTDGQIAIVGGNIDGLRTESGKLFIDPNRFDHFDQEIRFTIEGQETNAVITIFNHQELTEVQVIPSVTYNTSKTRATVTYVLEGNIPEEASSEWDFKGGQPTEEGPHVRMYTLPLPGSQTIEPTLTLSKGACENVIFIDPITFDDPLVPSLSIIPTFCMEAGTGEFDIDFTNISPPGGQIAIDGSNIEGLRTENGQLFIDPNSFNHFDQEIRFTIEGQETNAVITITNPSELTALETTREVSYNTAQTQATVIFTIEGTIPDGATPPHWDYKGGIAPDENPPEGTYIRIYDLPIPGNQTITPTLSITKGACQETIPVESITFEGPLPVTLSITPMLCLEGDSPTPINFSNISPPGGEIAIIGGDIPGLSIQNGQLLINHTIFDHFDQEIKFSIEGEDKGASITISDPEALRALEIERSINYNTGRTQATVTYIIQGTIPDGASPEMDYDGGRPSSQTTVPGTFIRIYDLPLPEGRTINPSLTITNGPCEETIPVDAITFQDPLPNTLNIKNEHCLEANGVNFINFTSISPPGGTIDIVEKDIAGIGIRNNQLEIDPITFVDFGTAIHFTIQGQPTTATITISNPQELNDLNVITTAVNHNNNNTQVDVIYQISEIIAGVEYDWHLGDGRTFTDAPDSKREWKVTYNLPVGASNSIDPVLTVSKGPCEEQPLF